VRRRGTLLAIPLLASVLTLQVQEVWRTSRVLASPRLPLQITAIARLRVAGEPTLVFDHLTDKRERDHLPDLSPTAWKEADGTVNLTVSHFQNYRMRGPDLEHLRSSPDVIFSSRTSAFDEVEEHYNYRHWLAAPYTFDGRTVYALGHHEWYACLVAGDCAGRGPATPDASGSYQLNSWANAVTSLVSADGGASWRLNGANGEHLLMPRRFTWTGSEVLAKAVYRRAFNHSGMMAPSRIIREGKYYYSMAFFVRRAFDRIDPATGQAPAEKEGWVLMRTADPTRSAGWEGWVSGDEYAPLSSHAFTVFQPGRVSGHPQMIYDTNARMYIAIFAPFEGPGPLYYVTTPTLASPSWSTPARVEGTAAFQLNPPRDEDTPEAPCSVGFQAGNYVSLIDVHSEGLNFEFTDGDPWLFYAYNPALGCGGDNLERDLFRVRLAVDYK
jgi:hypothetical protein